MQKTSIYRCWVSPSPYPGSHDGRYSFRTGGKRKGVEYMPNHTTYITCGENSLKYTFHETCFCLRFFCAMLFYCMLTKKCHKEDFHCHVYTIKIHPSVKTKF